jgi:hypothetical protein
MTFRQSKSPNIIPIPECYFDTFTGILANLSCAVKQSRRYPDGGIQIASNFFDLSEMRHTRILSCESLKGKILPLLDEVTKNRTLILDAKQRWSPIIYDSDQATGKYLKATANIILSEPEKEIPIGELELSFIFWQKGIESQMDIEYWKHFILKMGLLFNQHINSIC